ncbi:rod shape-determining protein MreC [Aestuariirhabdus litorea]|uniref:rod shape-determining protein MreC n=1 Tax=Aestuariirhabdus litorea TaxID=2528527 RepID=UPI001A9D4B8E|nr:rod shape-determining protein MreC [Aestuariirhabdus litorea]
MFTKGPSVATRVVLLAILSLGLMVVDHRYSYLETTRAWLSLLVTPVQWMANVPASLWQGVSDAIKTRGDLEQENSSLRTENMVLERRLQKLAALTAENVRLRELLNSSALLDDRVLVAELIGVDPDPYRHQVVVNKGSRDGVFVGQPVLDAEGLFGQVIEVSPLMSRVLLISDNSHSLPVKVNRNGVRAIASGTGQLDELILRHVPNTAEIVEGDLLISSGLGQRFPSGYPVGTVVSVVHDPGRPFAFVKVRPSARLNRSSHLLLVFTERPHPVVSGTPPKEPVDE